MVLVAGVLVDLFSGLPLARGRSWSTWLLGIVGFGTLYLLGEAAAGWIQARDHVTDPFSRRVSNLILLLALGLVVCAATIWIIWMAR